MADIRTIKRRIKSVKSTKQITKAMELVSAAKMRRAQAQVLASRPYVLYLQQTLTNLAALIATTGATVSNPLLEQRECKKTYFIVFSPDKGLCGSLPTNIFKALSKELSVFSSPDQYAIITLGKKAVDFVLHTKLPLVADFMRIKDNPEFLEISPLAKIILEDYPAGKVDKVKLIYTHFHSTLTQEAVVRTILPINKEELFLENIDNKAIQDEKSAVVRDYLFEPNPQEIFATLLPYFVEMSVYQSLLESKSSEHSARMVAMKSANEKAEEVIFDLTLSYNTARQSAITKEVAEISAGANALMETK